MSDFDVEVKKVIDIFITRKKYGVCLLSSTLLVNRLGEGKVIEGYQIIERNKIYIRHYWVSINDRDIDLGSEINRRLELPDSFTPTRLTEEIPGKDYFYASEIDLEELSELEYGYHLYLNKPKCYWKLIGARLGWIKKLVIKR